MEPILVVDDDSGFRDLLTTILRNECYQVDEAGSIAEVRQALGDLKFMSFYGAWDIDDTGLQVGHTMVDVQWQMGKRIIVWPPEAQTGRLAYPMPSFAEKAKGKIAVPR